MTNEEIVTSARFALMEQGLICTTGRMLTMIGEDGEETEVPEPEPIHTYATWKLLGYQVKKGSKAVAKLTIWKHTSKEDKETGEKKESMFMKNASFFPFSMVEKVTA